MTQLLLKHAAEPNRSISYSTYSKCLSFANQLKTTNMEVLNHKSTSHIKAHVHHVEEEKFSGILACTH